MQRLKKTPLNDHVTSYKKLINDLTREVNLTLTKRLTKDLINKYDISSIQYWALKHFAPWENILV